MREKNPHRCLPILAGLFATVLAGCTPDGGKPSPQEEMGDRKGASSRPAEPAAEAKPAAGREVELENDDFTFRFAYPAQAAAIPALKAKFDSDIETSRAQLAKDTAEFRAEAQKEGFPFRPYDQTIEWAVVTDLPDWLSLSAEIYAYTGGAHGNSGYDSLLWDRKANREREVLSLFASSAALEKAVQPALCDALDRERSKRRGGEKIVRNPDDWMTACIGLKDATLILGSAGRKAFDRIGILIGPYAAGPYAEGSYEVTLPVTPAVLGAVKPEFRGAFATGR